MTAVHLLNSIKPGGGENVAYNYARVLSKLNIFSTIVGRSFSLEYENMLIKDGIKIEKKLNRSILSESEYIFIHSNINLIKLYMNILLIKKQKKKVFYIQHLKFSKKKFQLLSILVNIICTDFIQITPITSNLVNKYININKHYIVNYYINKYSAIEYESIKKQIRQELNINNKIVFIFSGIFKHGKRVEDFINLAEKFNNNKDYFFLLLGDGQESNIVKQYNGSNLMWLGMVTDVEKYLIASDVYVFPSLFENEMLQMALVEAINTEKKILAYNTAINNYLLNNETCLTFNDMIERIVDDRYPQQLKRYDETYALTEIQKIL